jgi:hypothetical protein
MRNPLNDLKDYFVPHEGNGHRPGIFGPVSVSVLVLVIVGVFAGTVVETRVVQKSSEYLSAVLPGTLAELSNDDRADEGIEALSYNETLEDAAQLKADHMSENEYFAHDSPDGVTPWYWFDEAGYEFRFAGENLAVNFSESSSVEEAWMDSKGHRENILDPRFTEIGIATAEGEFEGDETTYVVQMFGTPKESEASGSDTQNREANEPAEEDEASEEETTENEETQDTGEDGDPNEEEVVEEQEADVTEEELARRLEVQRQELENVLGEEDDPEKTQQAQEQETTPSQEETDDSVSDPSGSRSNSDSGAESEESAESEEFEGAPLADARDSQSDGETQDASVSEQKDEDELQATTTNEREGTSTRPEQIEISTTSGFGQTRGPEAPVAVGTNDPAPPPSGSGRIFGWLYFNPTFILRAIYFVLGGLIILSLGLMVRQEAHREHPKEAFAGIGLVLLIAILSYTAQTLAVPALL